MPTLVVGKGVGGACAREFPDLENLEILWVRCTVYVFQVDHAYLVRWKIVLVVLDCVGVY
jgi:hypothetical protein